jgi:hypothetical protein
VFAQPSGLSARAYPADVAADVRLLQERYGSPQAGTPGIPETPEQIMALDASRWRQMLTAVAGDSQAQERARRYVDAWRRCYEWEGFHDCPEQDARAADSHRANPSALAEFLTLLAAHRWLCAAEGYEFEGRPTQGAESRRAFRNRVALAAKARSPMIRAAAQRLSARGTCFASK